MVKEINFSGISCGDGGYNSRHGEEEEEGQEGEEGRVILEMQVFYVCLVCFF